MDFFEQIAREQVRAMILNNARREDLSQVFSQGEMRLLGCLHAGADGRTAGELSMLLELSTARIAAMLNNLERKGAITRARDKADRRRVVVRLTAQGREEVSFTFTYQSQQQVFGTNIAIPQPVGSGVKLLIRWEQNTELDLLYIR